MHRLNILIPTINRKDLLRESLLTLDKQLEDFNKLLIIDNGHQNIHEIIHDLNMFKSQQIDIYESPNNLGVAGSWNFGIKYFRDFGDSLLVMNDDIVIGEDQLKKINTILDLGWLVTSSFLWSIFLISKPCWEYFLNKDGYVFDENFFPAYFEDNDFAYRLILARTDNNNEILHRGSRELDPIIQRNSMTIKKDSKLNGNFGKNERYFIKKWGGRPGHEKFKKPFGV